MEDKIKVLITDDSPTTCQILASIISEDARFTLQSIAENGLVAISKAQTFNPDLIIMDVNMPVMDGLTATREILKTQKTAIVAFTTEDSAEIGYQCLTSGALEVIRKPELASMDDSFRNDLLERLYQIACLNKRKNQIALQKNLHEGDLALILIGASTGGPNAILEVLKGFPNDFPKPIVVTQHIDQFFDRELVQWLKSNCQLEVSIAQDKEILKAGNVYLAPAGKHLCLERDGTSSTLKAVLNDDEPVSFLKPSVDKMFFSAAEVLKSRCIAILLTGMGKDGAQGLKALRDAGAYTIAESEESCVVFGMPKAAIDIGAAGSVLPLKEIAPFVLSKAISR